MKKHFTIACLAFLAACKQETSVMQIQQSQNKNIQDTTFDFFGNKVHDSFYGLEDDGSERTIQWVKDEQALTEKYLSGEKMRTEIRDRYTSIFNFEKVSAPDKHGDYYFFWKNTGLQPQAVCYVKKGMRGAERVFIDPNALDPKGLTTYSMLDSNDDHNLMAVAVSKAGSDWSNIHIFNIETGQEVEAPIEWVKFSGASWFGNGFFYSRYPAPAAGEVLSGNNMNHAVYYHLLGTSQDSDKLIYEDKNNPTYYNNAGLSEDKRYLFITSAPGTDGYAVYYKDIANGGMNFIPLFTDLSHHSSVVEVALDGELIVHTDVDAPNYRLVKVNPANPNPKNWKTIIPEDKRLLEGVSTCGGKLFLHYLNMANTEIEACDYEGKNIKKITLPDGTGTASGFSGKRQEKTCYFTFTSFTYPGVIYSFNVEDLTYGEYHRPSVDFNMNDYESKQVLVKSKDGTQVPLFLVHKKGLVLDGNNPTLLYGYGGFNISLTPSFSSSRLILLEQGGVFAMANLRGGGEFGENWHKGGMLYNKQNVFDDFLACADYLIENKYTSTNKLGIEGGSNGGLLVGACMTQHPEKFAVAFPAVGVLDMLRYHHFTVGKGWIPEYGSADESEQMFNYLKGYSPYHNLKPNTNYPATMVMTADHDDRVVPAHSFKFAAMLQECTTNERPALIRIETSAGHGAGKSTEQIIAEQTDKWTFFFKNVGHTYSLK